MPLCLLQEFLLRQGIHVLNLLIWISNHFIFKASIIRTISMNIPYMHLFAT